MAHKITNDCISCGYCAPQCNNGAIYEMEGIYKIDPEKCTDCIGDFDSPKCIEVCPVDAIVPDPNHKETKEKLLSKWGIT